MTSDRSNTEQEDWEADWESHRQWQLTAGLDATPAQRLAWLEEAIELAWKCGAHPALQSHILPLWVDGQASVVMGGGIVVDANGALVAQCDTAEEAIAMVASANGDTEDDVLRAARARTDYLDNVRRGLKRKR